MQHLRQALEAYEQYRDQALGEIVRSAVVQSFIVCWRRIRPTITRAMIRSDGLDRDEVKAMSLAADVYR